MEPMASPTRSDLLQTIREKKYRVSADYLLREIAGEYAIIPVGAASQISNAVMVPNDTAVAAAYHFGGRCTGCRRV